MGIGPTTKAWEALVLPLNYIRAPHYFSTGKRKNQSLKAHALYKMLDKKRPICYYTNAPLSGTLDGS